MILRKKYIDQITGYINKPVIKVITGMRRVGKSYFIRQIIDNLLKKGVSSNSILYINKELIKYDFIRDYKDLHEFVSEYFKKNKTVAYLFVDEIQEIEKWEKAISSFFAEEKYDIFITGSNSNLLSSEISTLISGRYVEINIYSLSFNEFLNFRKIPEPNINTEFKLYLQFGGFPVIHHFDFDEELIYQYINSLYNTILLKDVISRHNIRNVRLFQDIVKFVFSNLGQIFSSNSISKYLKNQKKNIGTDTIQNYLLHLESSFMIHKVQRYDIKGKKVLELYEKYYLGDIALKNAIVGYNDNDIAGMLENLVFLKLKQENYKVHIGKFDDYEVDFVAEKAGKITYIQVSYLLKTEKTRKREFAVLERIKDNFPKYVLTMDDLPASNQKGIIRMHIIDFLQAGFDIKANKP
ncbi:MAG: ATP-binding protein [Bacteroidales bacterium]|nr:ATP-binding protein [Bacteroidales bacterium]